MSYDTPIRDAVSHQTPLQPDAPLLGPALVLEAAPGTLRLLPSVGPGEPVDAVPAMPFRYDARSGDTVLAIGQAGRWYVIGVLNGHGATVIEAPGDLSVTAPNGTLRLAAAAVEVDASRVETVARHVAVTARALVNKVQEATLWVAGRLDTRAGSSRLTVDGLHAVHAEQVLALARKQVKIDGETINLG